MSILKHIIEIIPNRYSDRKEVKEVKGIECPRCHGAGGSSEQTGRDEYNYTPCVLCGGNKKVKATITIEWGPDYNC